MLRMTHGKTALGASSPANAPIITKLQSEEETITSNYADNWFQSAQNDVMMRRNTYSQPCTCRNHYQ